MTAWPILSLVTFLPLVGVLLILFIKDDSENARRNIRAIALLTTTFTFIISVFIWTGFDNSQSGFQFVEKAAWLDSGISYHMNFALYGYGPANNREWIVIDVGVTFPDASLPGRCHRRGAEFRIRD